MLQNGSIYKKIIQCKGQQLSKRQQSTRVGNISGQNDKQRSKSGQDAGSITTKLRFKGEYEGRYCACYFVLSILSLLSRKSWIAYRSGSLGLHPVGIMKLVVLARDCLACKDLLHLHCGSKGWRLRCTDWASATWSGDASCVLQTQEVLALPCRSTSTGYKHSNSTTSHAGANTMCIFT